MSAKNMLYSLLTEYILVRQNNVNRDEAWVRIQSYATSLNERQLDRLEHMVGEWENKEGYRYTYSKRREKPSEDPNQTEAERPEDLEAALQHASLNHTGFPTLSVVDPSSGDTSEIVNPFITDIEPNDTTFFAEDAKLTIYFKDFPQKPLSLEMKDGKEFIIGRMTDKSPMAPDIDIQRLGGGDYGVSRIHATIERRGTTLLITDLGSLNQTFINDERIRPHEVRVVKHGDFIRFARLLTAFHFQV